MVLGFDYGLEVDRRATEAGIKRFEVLRSECVETSQSGLQAFRLALMRRSNVGLRG
jgi:hypothetical protein